jgi:pimeloyl-ACP methyl ester carboxylesterase
MRSQDGSGEQLDTFVAPIISTLQAVAGTLTHLHDQVRDGQDTLDKQRKRLAGDGPTAFIGLAAESFGQAVDHSMQAGQTRVNAIQEAIAACDTCVNAITHVTQTAESRLTDDYSTGQVLQHFSLDALINDAGVVGAAVKAEHDKYASDYYNEHLVDPGAGGAVTWPQAEEAADAVYGPIGRTMAPWGQAVHDAAQRWKRDLGQAAQDVSHWEPDLVPANEQQLAQMIFAQYGTGKPVGITQTGDGTLLVTLAGVEMKPNQANTLPNAIDAGGGDMNNAYEQQVMADVEAYLAAHPELKQPVHIIIAGHSYGGIVAQELAYKAAHHQTNFAVDDVITFGSPQVVQQQQSGITYREYFDQYDFVPMASSYEAGKIVPALGAFAGLGPFGLGIDAGIIATLNSNPDLKRWYTGEIYVPDVGKNPNPLDWINSDHGAYVYSKWLGQQALPFSMSDLQATSTYSAPALSH